MLPQLTSSPVQTFEGEYVSAAQSTATGTSTVILLPDLVVSEAGYGGNGHGCSGIFGYTYDACVSNVGEAPAGESRMAIVSDYKPLMVRNVPSLEPGEEHCEWGGGPIEAVLVDIFGEVVESMENNNHILPEDVRRSTPGATCTATATATYTPYPTYTPYSTYTPYPTYTPHPTHTPTWTATLTPTPTQWYAATPRWYGYIPFIARNRAPAPSVPVPTKVPPEAPSP